VLVEVFMHDLENILPPSVRTRGCVFLFEHGDNIVDGGGRENPLAFIEVSLLCEDLRRFEAVSRERGE
jgi:hypothetical protein